MIMLDDAVRANAKEDDVRVVDVSQLLEESMGPSSPNGYAPAPVVASGPEPADTVTTAEPPAG
jgi:hypothetical protein